MNISEVEQQVISCFNKHKKNYGRIRIKKELERCGVFISECMVARIMRENGLVSKGGRKKRSTKPKKTPAEYISENLFREIRKSTEHKDIKPNTIWSADLSEFKCYKGKFYASGIIDVASKKVVGIHTDSNMRQELVHETIEMAYNRFSPKEGIIFHSDRGSQYTANKTKKLLDNFNMKSSMSRPGSPNDNQPIESLWKTIKHEIGDELAKLPYEKAKLKLIKHIEFYYNSDRLHSSLGYITPNEYWEQYI